MNARRNTAPTGAQPVFSRPFDVNKAADEAVRIEVEATEAERIALAEVSNLPAIGALAARLKVTATGRGRFEVTGEVRAHVTQVCVVSLESFDTDIREPVEISFAPPEEVQRLEESYAKRREEDPSGQDIEEPPDQIVNGRIDLGAVAAEFLVLALDPYPHKPGVAFAEEGARFGTDEETSPFAALAGLRKPDQDR